MNKSATHGFTLIELMVTVAVAGVVLTVGVPSFREMIQENRAATNANSFVTAVHFARNEAIKRGQRVSLCKSVDGATCTTSGGWQQGWIVFLDPNNAGVVDTGETIIRVSGGLIGTATLLGNNNVQNRLSFLASGFSGGTNGQLILCDERIQNFSTDKKKARVLIISTTGRPSLVKGDDSSVSLTSCSP